MKKYLYLIALSLLALSCENKRETEAISFDSAKSLFVDYISAHTSGIISSQASIKVKLAKSIADVTAGTVIEETLFRFEPKLNGTLSWQDNRTLVFTPETPLVSGTAYNATLNLSAIIPEAEEKGDFKFSFKAIPQNFEVKMLGMSLYDPQDLSKVKLNGIVQTADVVQNEEVEKIIQANQDQTSLKFTWNHPSETKHLFTIENVKRGESESEVEIAWDGKSIQVDETDDLDYTIPSINDYKVIGVNINRAEQNYISVLFSDPLHPKQNLTGFITLGSNSPRFVINQNELKIFPTEDLNGTVQLKIFSKIKNTAGYSLKEDYIQEIELTQAKPEVRVAGKSGSIIPNSEGLIVPFEAIGLKAVDVTVIQIFEDNVIQYMQSNNIGESYELKKVGRPIAKKSINLMEGGVTDLNQWNRYSLDISEFTKVQPGAFYQIEFSFRKKQSNYFCANDDQGDDNETELESWDEEEENSNWDSYESYSYNDYDWYERENPCHDSYYMYRSEVNKLVFASDLGLIAKRGDHGLLHVFTTNMLDTKPMGSVNFAVYDYQQQVIGSAISDENGQAKIKLTGKPFMLMAKSGAQFGYLKLQDGGSLSLSNFNVTGQKVQKGLKGYIYGERGVWRPGDDIHLTFILEDKEKTLPEGYPVVVELMNPMGQKVSKKVTSESVSGMYGFTLSTDSDAPTGSWEAVVKAAGIEFKKSLKIESIKPNRLKVELDFNKDKLTALDEVITGDLEVKWLHGAVAKGLKVVYEMMMVPMKTSFEDYPNFSFDDESKNFYSERQEVFSGRLDQKGKAQINIDMYVDDNPPGALKAIFTGKVYEEGGNFSVDNFSIPYYPYTSFVGVKVPEGDKRGMLLTDEDHNIRIVSIDAEGKPVSRRNVQVDLYKLDWRWWWDNSYDDISNYVGRSYHTPIQKTTINTSNGEGSWDLQIKYPDWGRYYVQVTDPVSGHSAGHVVYLDWPGWAGKGKRGDAGGVSMLSFEVEKKEYKVGEQIKLTFPSSKGSRVLVSLETGKKVLQAFWVETEEKSTAIQFESTADMAPNIYAHITLIQPHAQTANDLPIRMYGVQSIKVVDPNTVLSPQLVMPSTLRPEQTFKVEVSEKEGRPMAYTLAMVDDGLLDLTRFKTPSPWLTFYAREALGIKTWDVYDDVIGAYGGKIERLMAIGGDGEMDNEETKEANRFKPVVKFLGPFQLEAGKSASHEIKMPQYVGSVRMMLVTAQEGAYGSVDKTIPVKQPVMVLATLPRVAGPGEEMDLPVTVFASGDDIKQVQITVENSGQLKLIGEKSKIAKFPESGEQVIYFKVKASEALGVGKIKVIAKSGNITAEHEIELNVRASNPEVVDVDDQLIAGSETWSTSYEPLGMIGTNGALIELSSLPSLNLEKRLRYLVKYPHGCIEQTTSSVFAQLYLEDLTNVSDEMKSKISTNINAAINRLKKFQTVNGGFAYWPGQPEESDWGTNYAGHFMIEAKKKGYAIPEAMLSSWVKYQKKQANQWSKKGRRQNDLVQAYRLYTLAIAGEKSMAAMNRLKEMDDISDVARWRLALAYAINGFDEPAEKMIEALSKEVNPYDRQTFTYGSRIRDRAMILETLSYLDRREEAYPILEEIAMTMGDNSRWMSTQTTAFSLIGVMAYTQGNDLMDNLDFEVNIGSVVASFTKGKYVTQISIDADDKASQIKITNKGGSPIYARLIRSGIPLVGQESAGAKNINMTVKYKDSKGLSINVNDIPQGTDFIAEVSVHHPGVRADYEELALSQIFPSGWEILNSRMDATGQGDQGDKPEYLDIRDDRALIYFDLRANERKTFNIRLNASYKGKYYLPAVAVEAMYDNTIYSRTEGKWVSVGE